MTVRNSFSTYSISIAKADSLVYPKGTHHCFKRNRLIQAEGVKSQQLLLVKQKTKQSKGILIFQHMSQEQSWGKCCSWAGERYPHSSEQFLGRISREVSPRCNEPSLAQSRPQRCCCSLLHWWTVPECFRVTWKSSLGCEEEKMWLGAHRALCLPLPQVQTTKKSGGSDKLSTVKILGKELGHHNDVSPLCTLCYQMIHQLSIRCVASHLFTTFFPFFPSTVDLYLFLEIRGRNNDHRTDFDSQTSTYINHPWQHQYITFLNILSKTWSWN